MDTWPGWPTTTGGWRRPSRGRGASTGRGRPLQGALALPPPPHHLRPRGPCTGSPTRLYPGDPCYRDVDVRVGDVVVRVNGKSIERPEQASDVFSSLRTAPALVVDLLRAGEPRTVSLSISEE